MPIAASDLYLDAKSVLDAGSFPWRHLASFSSFFFA